MKILILGIGNTLLSDEGVGVHVIQAMAKDISPDDEEIVLVDGGTLSFTLAGPIGEAESLVVVDAAEIGQAPGSLQVYEGEAMDRFLLGNRKSSVHEVGLTDLMSIARLTDTWPARRALVAIQPAKVDWGDDPTVPVAAAIPVACARIRGLIDEWRHGAE